MTNLFALGMGVARGSQNCWRRWGFRPLRNGGVAGPLKHTPPKYVTVPSLVVKRYERYVRKYAGKKQAPRSSRQGHSRSSAPIRTDWQPMSDFLLVIHSNHGPIPYRFRDKRRFRSKIEKQLSHLVYLMSPLTGFSLRIL